MTPVRLESAVPRSRVKHSTTEPLHSHDDSFEYPQHLFGFLNMKINV